MRMLALHNYLSATTVRRVDTKRLAAELKVIGYSLGRISGPAAAWNNRVWLNGPNSTENDEKAIELLAAQAKRLRIDLG
jgi:hypothetical protein